MSSSSAISSSACAFTCLLQLGFQRIAVDAVVRLVQLVGKVMELMDRVPRHDPQRFRLLTAGVLLVRVRLRKGHVRRVDRPGVRERNAFLLLAEDLVDQAASFAFGSLPRGKPCFPREPPSFGLSALACAARMSPHASTIKNEGTSRFPPSPSTLRATFGVTQLQRARPSAPMLLAPGSAGGTRAAPASSARGR